MMASCGRGGLADEEPTTLQVMAWQAKTIASLDYTCDDQHAQVHFGWNGLAGQVHQAFGRWAIFVFASVISKSTGYAWSRK